jgi:Flp pilus assembly protein TadG
MILRHKRRRHAATIVEFAIVAPITFLLVLGLVIGAMGIFRYQQMARLSRDASRWASVHGTQYAAATNNPPATATDVYNQVIAPNATGLDLSELTYSVTWNTDNSPFHTVTVNGTTQNVANTVTVTLTYQWIPEAYLGGITMSTTSVTVMSY